MNYVSIQHALGMIVLAGHKPEVFTEDTPSGKKMHILVNGREVDFPIFRDGATWKAKEEAVEDWIDAKTGEEELEFSEEWACG